MSRVTGAEVAIEAAAAGAGVVRRRFGTPLERFAKDGGDFATTALAEESGSRGGGARVWLLDPLCGTP